MLRSEVENLFTTAQARLRHSTTAEETAEALVWLARAQHEAFMYLCRKLAVVERAAKK